MPNFDAIIIGTGQSGPALARRLVAAGRKVAIIERKLFGGTCVNTGCTPTKTLIASAYAAHVSRRAADYGIRIEGPVNVDMKAVKTPKDGVVSVFRNGVEQSLKTLQGRTVYQGHGRFIAKKKVAVNGSELAADQIFINVGARAAAPPTPGLDQVPYLTNSSMMDIDFLPPHLVIMGGSYIGLEFAQAYRRFGSEVTVIELGPRLISREDSDVSQAAGFLKEEGIDVRLDSKIIGLEKQGDSIAVNIESTGGISQITGTHMLVATGPATKH
jgi:pyruvate/2-oxoglutarate dehydrogenase complex dihydrolipoamide dehydrogenase (E3) component